MVQEDQKELIFDPIDVEDFKRNVHTLLGWNMQPLTTAEMLRSGDALHCPTCKKLRYVMFKAAISNTPLVYMGEYCTCGEISQGQGTATLTHEDMMGFLADLKGGRVG